MSGFTAENAEIAEKKWFLIPINGLSFLCGLCGKLFYPLR